MVTFSSNPKNARLKDIAVRAAKTWTQAFLAVITTGLLDITDTNAFKALVIAGVASGISAVWNGFVKPV